MPSANTGKQIVAVKASKKSVWLYFDDGQKLALSPSVYSDFYLYAGKSLSEKEFREITQQNEIGKLREYAHGVAALHNYTRKQMSDKLYRKKATGAMIEAIINELIEHHLVDEKAYVQDYLDYAKERHYGEYKIRADLLRAGIPSSVIQTLRFDREDEDGKAQEVAEVLLKKWTGLSDRERRRRLHEALLLRGFSEPTAHACADHLPESDASMEKAALQKDLEKAKRLYEGRYRGRELRERKVRYLLQKGYNYSDIEDVLEDHTYDLDQ